LAIAFFHSFNSSFPRQRWPAPSIVERSRPHEEPQHQRQFREHGGSQLQATVAPAATAIMAR
jgi:hypothetical protein